MSINLLPTDPDRWGPSAWDFLYCIAFSYPNKPTRQEKKDMLNFLTNMGNILPCLACRSNYNKNITKNPIKKALVSKRTLILYIMKMKNEIARKKRRKKLDTYSQLSKKYHLNKLKD